MEQPKIIPSPVSFDDLDDFDNVQVYGKSESAVSYDALKSESGVDDAAEFAKVKSNAPLVNCPKCGGSGMWRGGYGAGGTCFKCGGTGKVKGLKMDARSVQSRQKAFERRQQKKLAEAQRVALAVLEFSKQHPKHFAWLNANANGFEFAGSLNTQLHVKGYLTDGQMAAIDRNIEKAEARAVEKAKAVEASKTDVKGAGFDALIAAFQRASSKGLKNPALQMEFFCMKPAKATSRNPGCIYVTESKRYGSTYYGKIDANGVFYPSRECSDDLKAKVQAVGQDPLGQVVLSGRRTGNCACCGLPLTKGESIDRGIGPICYEKYFGG